MESHDFFLGGGSPIVAHPHMRTRSLCPQIEARGATWRFGEVLEDAEVHLLKRLGGSLFEGFRFLGVPFLGRKGKLKAEGGGKTYFATHPPTNHLLSAWVSTWIPRPFKLTPHLRKLRGSSVLGRKGHD